MLVVAAVALLELSAVAPRALDGEAVVEVDGAWEARLSDVGGATDVGTWQPARVPGSFSFQGFNYDGVVWLRLGFTVTHVEQDYAVRVPMTSNAYEVFVNGTRVGGRGAIGPDGALVRKDFRSQVYRLPKELLHTDAPNTVALRVRTFYGNGGVMAPGVLLGPELAVREMHERSMARVAMLVALFLFAGFFHIVLFLGRTRESHYLSFAWMSLSLASITAGINTLGYLVTDNPDFNAYLVFVPLVVMPLAVVHFFSDFFSRRVPRLRRVMQAVTAVALGSLIASTAVHQAYPLFERLVLPLSMLALVGALVLSAWWTLGGLREKQLGARAIAVGLAAYGISGSWELAWTFGWLKVRIDSYLGFALFIGAAVAAIATRFAWLHRQVELGERDALTGCLTRRGFQERLAAVLEGHPEPTCIVFDLDHFKRINDEHGHQVGDDVLRYASETVRGVLRATDLVARWGGEEFLVLLPELAGAEAAEVAERLRAAVEREEVRGVVVTASFGLATRLPGEDFEAWFARADKALYEAKGAGRNCVRAAA